MVHGPVDSLNESAVAVLNLATRLMELPIGVFTVAVSTVVFPLIAKHAAAGDWPNLSTSYRKGMRLILVINVPAAIGLMPVWTRRPLRLPWFPVTERTVVRALGSAATGTIRWALRPPAQSDPQDAAPAATSASPSAVRQ